MRLDKDILAMSPTERGQALMRVRTLLRSHRQRRGNARCWHADVELYERALPEGSRGADKMDLPKEKLLHNCERYIDRQQCGANCPYAKSRH